MSFMRRVYIVLLVCVLLIGSNPVNASKETFVSKTPEIEEPLRVKDSASGFNEDPTAAEATIDVPSMGLAADEPLAESAPAVQAEDSGEVERTAGAIDGNALAGISESSDENGDEVPKIDERSTMRVLNSKATDAEAMSIDITLDKTTVAVGETVTANWTISGVAEPIKRFGCYWYIYYSDGTSTCTTELSDLTYSTSYTPDKGVKCQLDVYAVGADGRVASGLSGYVTITGAPPTEPMSIDIALDKTTVEIGETVTANWTISGVVEPYKRFGCYWYIYYSDGTSTCTTELSDLTYSTSYTPDKGVKCQLDVYAVGADGRAKSAYSGYVTIIPAYGYVKSMMLNKTSYSMHADDVVTLVATPMPESALDRSVTWSSSNESVATVSSAGVVTAKALGTAGIAATANDGSGVSASCTIEVLEDTIVLPKAYMYGLTRGYATISGIFTSYVSFNIGAQLGAPPYQFTYRVYRNGVLIYTGTSTQAGPITLTGSGLNTYGTYTFSLDVTDSLGYKDHIIMGDRMTIASGSTSISSDGSTNPKVYATSVSMNKSDLLLGVGATGNLSASVLPTSAANKNIKWKSSNPDVASISQSGMVTGNAEGSAVITAMATDGSMVRTTCSITVRRLIEFIAVSQDAIMLHTGETGTIAATISPANATISTLRFQSSNTNVATVNESGEVTAHKAGTVTIKISATDGSGIVATVKLQVLQYAIGIASDEASAILYTGKTLTLTPTFSPDDVSNKGVAWISSDEAIATVADGVVTAIKAGSTTITATTADGSNKSVTCEITVKQSVTSLTLDKTSATLYTGDTRTLVPTVSPDDASDPSVSWSSSNETVATVANGVVTARKAGSATITVAAVDGSNKNADCIITVKQYATGIALDKASATLYTGETLRLIQTVSPSDASDPSVTWLSSDEAVATVTNGVVAALKAGSTTITATTTDGSNKSATCEITVKQCATGVVLDETSATLYTGDRLTLTPTVSPSDVSDKSVTWTSSDETVATVSSSGVVTALEAGSTTITATAADGSGKGAACQITVKQYATGLALNKASAALHTGDTLTLNATVSPAYASNKDLTWTSGDSAVAAVSDSGVVTAIKAGSTTITATTTDGSNKSATCEITVKQYVTGVSLDKTTATLCTGDALSLQATILPDDASDPGVTWTSSDVTVATVTGSGVVTARKTGNATITATAADGSGKSAACDVAVKQCVTRLTLDKDNATLYTGDTLMLNATILPDDASDKRVTWYSDNENVAEVSSSGLVTGVRAGTATIIVTAADGTGFKASCEITVKQSVTKITLNPATAALYPGKTLLLTPTVSPIDADDVRLVWSSSDEAVATVASGLVTTVKAGTASITATAVDGSGVQGTCVITVKQYVTGVSLDRDSAGLYPGKNLTLTATAFPDNASDKGLSWRSGDETVALVYDGVVTALKAGSTTITATASDGSGKSASCEITVWVPASSVSMNPTAEALLKPGDVLSLTANVQPENAHERSVTWSTSNASVARVDGGAVTAVGRGTATITATTHNGKTATCTVTVEDRVVDLTLSVPDGTPEEEGAYTLPVNATLQIGASVKPEGIDYGLTYKSFDAKVASVSRSGLITGLKNGQTTITVTAKDSKGLASKSKTLTVSVFTPVGSVSLPGEAQILTGAVKRLKATVSPSGASDKSLTWASDNETVASVAQDGTVTANAVGTATITAKAKNVQSASCLVRVTDPATAVQITTETGETYVNCKAYLQLNAQVSPGTANQEVTWKSNNTDFVTVGADGRAYGKKVGKATVYATAADGTGARGSIVIQVITPVKDVVLPEAEKVFIGKSKKLTAVLSPSSPTFKGLFWKSDNEAVATVAPDGTVTALALGAAVITATAYNGLSDSCTITVTQPVEKIALTQKDGYLLVYKGETAKLDAAIAPDNAGEQGVTWKSTNTKYATVNERGEVTGKAAGKVTLTATAKDGSGVSDSINLTIVTPEVCIKLSKSSAVLYHNGETAALKTIHLTASASPKGAVYRTLTWKVVSGDAATVDESTGVVTAVKEGTAVVQATTDSSHTADCTVTVRTLPASFTLNTTEKTLAFKQSFDLGAEAQMDGTEPALTWKSNNTKVATVSSDGIVKASKDKTGTAVITAKTVNGLTATCTVTVVRSLPKGAPGASTAEAAKPVIGLRLAGGGYESSDNRVAEVGENGDVELKMDGEVTLQAGGERIIVDAKECNPVELQLDKGSKLILLTDTQIQWRVGDERVASIDKNGLLIALSEGTTEVACEAEDGSLFKIRITVSVADDLLPLPSQTNEEPVSTSCPTTAPEMTAEPKPTASPEPTPAPEPTAAPEQITSDEEAAPPKPEPEPDRPSDAQAGTGAAG